MKQFFYLFLLGILMYSSVQAQSKYDFDVKDNPQAIEAYTNYLVSGTDIELSMMNGGYFTIGTTKGLSAKISDDYMSLLYGHPYAYTSFPYIIINGEKITLDRFFRKDLQSMESSATSLTYSVKSNEFIIEFSLAILPTNTSLRFNYKIVNVSGSHQELGMGLFFDPEIGQGGDGQVAINNQFVLSDSNFITTFPNDLFIYERSSNPSGLGYQLDFQNNIPDNLRIGNWEDVYGGSNRFVNQAIFDVAIDLTWGIDTISSGDSMEVQVDLNLDRTKLPTAQFMRWDMPSFLSLSDQRLFPANLETTVEIINETTVVKNVLKLILPEKGPFLQWKSKESFDVAGKKQTVEHALVRCLDSYKDEIIPLKIQLVDKNNQLVDEIIRQVFVPATPFSDSGLFVSIDSLILGNFPQIEVEFHVENELTGQIISQLTKYNLGLTEDSLIISNDSFSLEKSTSGGVDEVDIIFVLDVTGSMTDDIEEVKSHINEFADSLELYSIDYRLGMVTFLDVIENVYDFTSNVNTFYKYINEQYAHGGGDGPENSLDALKRATEFSFRPAAKRIIIWITDAPFHIQNQNTNLSIMDVVNLTLNAGITVFAVGPTSYQTEFFDQIVLNTNGKFFDINGNMRDVLLEVSRMQSSGNFVLKYNSPASFNKLHKGIIEIHYAGLGGEGEFTYKVTRGGAIGISTALTESLKISPNPVLETLNIQLPDKLFTKGELSIYDATGKLEYASQINSSQVSINKADFNSSSKAGVYILKIIVYDADYSSEVYVSPFIVNE
ncbi:MAG: VWA domain-containing protein [Bacteroidetes bacterium]|nr:VWA domain-containing protein [Bacteroidota bacterium]